MENQALNEIAVDDASKLKCLLRDLVESRSFDLPLLPESSSSLLRMCNDPDCSPRDLSECIRRDQSIATHLLRVSNSTMYSSGTPIVSLQQAVARLGTQRIREIVLIISCQGRVFDVKGFEEDVHNSFRASLAVAAFAQEVARSCRLNVEEAFLSGLLHDIGRPVLLQAVADLLTQHDLPNDKHEILESIEEYRIEIGKALIEAWNLPEHVGQTVGQQLLEDAKEGCREAKILNLAISIADWLNRGLEDTESLRTHPMLEQLNIYPDQLDTILGNREMVLEMIEAIS